MLIKKASIAILPGSAHSISYITQAISPHMMYSIEEEIVRHFRRLVEIAIKCSSKQKHLNNSNFNV